MRTAPGTPLAFSGCCSGQTRLWGRCCTTHHQHAGALKLKQCSSLDCKPIASVCGCREPGFLDAAHLVAQAYPGVSLPSRASFARAARDVAAAQEAAQLPVAALELLAAAQAALSAADGNAASGVEAAWAVRLHAAAILQVGMH